MIRLIPQFLCFVTLLKNSCFFDGNKRTGIIIANHILIQNGIGIMKISEDDFPEFSLLLNKYYNYGHTENIHYDNLRAFIITNCIN
jgi:prophage maintenance system killer protein